MLTRLVPMKRALSRRNTSGRTGGGGTKRKKKRVSYRKRKRERESWAEIGTEEAPFE